MRCSIAIASRAPPRCAPNGPPRLRNAARVGRSTCTTICPKAGAAKSLVEASGDLSRADLGAVLDHGDRARVNYYNARLAGLAPAHGAIRSILSRIPDDGLIIGEVMTMARQLAPGAGFDGGPGLYRALLHAGVLHEDGTLMCRCPIPSFRRHILDTLPAESRPPFDC